MVRSSPTASRQAASVDSRRDDRGRRRVRHRPRAQAWDASRCGVHFRHLPDGLLSPRRLLLFAAVPAPRALSGGWKRWLFLSVRSTTLWNERGLLLLGQSRSWL